MESAIGGRLLVAYGGELGLAFLVGTVVALGVVIVRTTRAAKAAEDKTLRMNRLYAVLSGVNQLILRARDPATLYAGACRVAIEKGGFRLAWVGLLDPNEYPLRFVAFDGPAAGFVEAGVGIYRRLERAIGPVASVIEAGKPVVVNDIAGDPHMGPWHEESVRHGLRSRAIMPFGREGRMIGAFAVFSEEVGFFDAGQYALLCEVADDLGFALAQMEIDERRRVAERELARLNEELERRVAERTAELEAANKSLEAFSASVSHDLRAPLRAVDGYCLMIEEDYAASLGAEGMRLFAATRQNVRKMSKLVEDLLAFARSSRAKVELARVDMRRLVTSAWEEARAVSTQCEAHLVLGELPAARGDPSLLTQVWANLLGNAAKYSAKSAEPRVEVSGELSGEEAVYRVSDNGVGFDMKEYERLFEAFQRLHSAREFPGSGVGLATVHRIVTRHGGRVWAESREGEGATFFFALPA